MEWTPITINTLITQIPSIIEKNNLALQTYLDIFYDEARGIIIKPIETTGKIKAGNGEFVNMVVDNLSVKNQYTNIYDNITTADYDFYKTFTDPVFIPRVADASATIYENPSYKYIDVNKPYYKIANDSSIAFKSDNLSQVVHIIFDTSTALSNNFTIQLNPTNSSLDISIGVAAADLTYVELILTNYDVSWGSYWSLYKYGSL